MPLKIGNNKIAQGPIFGIPSSGGMALEKTVTSTPKIKPLQTLKIPDIITTGFSDILLTFICIYISPLNDCKTTAVSVKGIDLYLHVLYIELENKPNRYAKHNEWSLRKRH